MEILNYDDFIGKIQFRSIRIYPTSNLKKNFITYKNNFSGEKGKMKGLFFVAVFFEILPKITDFFFTASERSNQNLSHYNQFLFKK